MAINKNRVMEAAQKFVEKNQLDKAIKEYLKIVEEDAKDVRVWLKLGDLYAKKQSKQEATDTYLRVAQFYGDQGFYLKAVAVYKQVLRLDPRLIDVNIRLAEVYRHLGLLSDAMQQYELVAAFYHREGKTREALATIRELVELDPENVATRIKLAKLYSKEQLVKEAVAEFSRAADFLRAAGRMDDFIKVAERLVWHQPDNRSINRELAQLYLKRNDARHALQKLQVCFKADPRDIETLSLLAAAFLALDQRQKTVSVWKELARIHTENNQHNQALEVHRRILSVAPDDPDALAGVGGRRAVGTGNAAALAVPAPVLAARPATPIGSEPGERPVPRLATPVRSPEQPLMTLKTPSRLATPIASPPVAVRPAGGVVEVELERDNTSRDETATIDIELPERDPTPAPERAATDIARLLDQADVYVKYGLREKAIGHLQRVFEIDPQHVDARVRLKESFEALGRHGDAAVELGRLIEEPTAPSDRARAERFLRELQGVGPDTGRIRELAERHGLTIADGDEDDAEIQIETAAPTLSSEMVAIDASIVEETTAVGDLELDESPDDGTIGFDSSELAVEIADPVSGDTELAFDDMSGTEGGERTHDAPRPSLDDLEGLGEEPLEAAEVEEDSIDPSDVALEESLGPLGPPTERPGGGIGISLEDDLDEADFFVSQKLYEEARAILRDLLARHPGHPLIVAKMRDLPESAATTTPSSAPSIDDAPRRPAVIARPVGGPDADTHYDLGLAYKEMGLHDEAIREFALVRETPGRAVQCHLMIGLCHVERGQLPEAVDEFKAGLYVEGITDREALALYFELGAAYEALGDPREALYYFEKVQKREARFRDVERRIHALTGNPGGNGKHGDPQRPRGEIGESSSDEAMRALDALLDESDITPP